MLKVGLTGNIGSGKSLVSEIFSILGVPVYHADRESKKFLVDPAVKEKILSFSGDKILDASEEIDRGALATFVFSDDKALAVLDSILHPLVLNDFIQWSESFREHPYVIQEAAILFESGVADLFDKIIHVSCPKEIAIDRAMKRDGTDRKSVLRRMRFQMEDSEKARLSDFVINNDGSEMIIPQVISINELLSGSSAQHTLEFYH
jgi:dephospho-CoA kinase